ncbi:hypothetical protein J3F84DRAFT_389550 [Trichoderma pleuroticola]
MAGHPVLHPRPPGSVLLILVAQLRAYKTALHPRPAPAQAVGPTHSGHSFTTCTFSTTLLLRVASSFLSSFTSLSV